MINQNNNKSTYSLPKLIELLWKDNFFSESKEISEILTGISTKGFHFSIPSLRIALTRLVKQKGFLSRAQYSGKMEYIQRYPPTPVSDLNAYSFEQYNFHHRIKEVAFKQFRDGYFKEAIQNSFVEVVDQVKIKTGHPKKINGHELDGDDLMNHVFGCDNQIPLIKFNSLETSLDKAEQRGIMNLFKGIVGIRDKKAHLNFIQNDRLKTIEYLSLASLLLRLLEEHTLVNKDSE